MYLYYNQDTLDILNYIDIENGGFKTTYAPASNVASIEYPLNDTYITIERSENGDVFVKKPQITSNIWMYYDKDAMKILSVYDCGLIDHASARPQSEILNLGHEELPLGINIEFLDIRADENGDVTTFTNKNREKFHWTHKNWENIRKKRNTLLSSCDWTQSLDSPLPETKKQEWCSYRQALRDITSTYSTPSDVIWPVQPI